jgi:hypothetical protein
MISCGTVGKTLLLLKGSIYDMVAAPRREGGELELEGIST